MLKINKDIKTIIDIDNKKEFQDLIKDRLKMNPDFLDLRYMHFNEERCKDMDYQFMKLNVREIDVTGWNTSHFKTISYMFAQCPNLIRIIGLDTWEVSNITEMTRTFWKCPMLEDIGDISKWKLNINVGLNAIFEDTPKVDIPSIFDRFDFDKSGGPYHIR